MKKGPRDGIYERKNKNGKVSRYCFQIRKDGFAPVFKSYRSKTKAVKERNRILVSMEDGKFVHTTGGKKHTLGQLIERYEMAHREKILTSKQSAEIRWWKINLGDQRLSDLTPVLITEYRLRSCRSIE